MKYLAYLFIVFVILACSEPHERTAALSRAIAVMNDDPDSALHILDSLKENEQQFGRHFRMQCRLHRINALNKLDTLFHSTEEVQQLADYFDSHGTPNEQMLAHYLLGRAYYDKGESPMALKCYQDAVAKADTTAMDCDYGQLSKVYGQMGTIFWQQNLLQHNLDCADKATKYAWMAGDTINALLNMAEKITIYEECNKSDSSIYLCEHTFKQFCKYGYAEIGASMLGNTVGMLVKKGNMSKAKHYMDIYETQSGFFNADGDIEHGREVYYYTKGQYYLAINKYDSAEYFFRKELCDGKDFNNQNAASKGLAKLFSQTNIPDSAAKYALYSYEMNDSVYAKMATEEVGNIYGLYNYIRHQEKAQEAKERASAEHNKVKSLACILFIVIMSGVYYILKVKKKRKEMSRRYHKKIAIIADLQSEISKLTNQKSYLDNINALALQQAKSDIDILNNNVRELHDMITEKESMIIKLQSEMQVKYKSENLEQDLANEKLIRHSGYPILRELSAKGKMPNDSQWQNFKEMAAYVFPEFYRFISLKDLNEKEFYTCILLRMFVKPKAIANMLGVTQSYISKIRSEMLFKLFNAEGTPKDFDERIQKMI